MKREEELTVSVKAALRAYADTSKAEKCPICAGTESCDHTVKERLSAALLSTPKPEAEPVAWVIPGSDNAREDGFLDAMAWREGEFTVPLYAHPPKPEATKPLNLGITKEWFEKRAAKEGDLEIGAGFSVSPEYLPGFVPSAADRHYNGIIAKLHARIVELEAKPEGRLPYDLRLQIGKALDRLVCDDSTPEQVDQFIATFREFGLTISEATEGGAHEKGIAELLAKALRRSMVALDDWLHVYAPDECKPERVAEAKARLWENGTLAYIADVQAQNRYVLAALNAKPEQTDGRP